MVPPLTAPQAPDGKFATHPGPVLVVFAAAGYQIKPDARSVQLIVRDPILCHVIEQFLFQVMGQTIPLRFARAGPRRQYKSGITHVQTAHAAAAAIRWHGQQWQCGLSGTMIHFRQTNRPL